MLYRWISGIVLLIAACALFAGCRALPPETGSAESVAVPIADTALAPHYEPSEADVADAHAHYGMAVIDELEDKPDSALDEYFDSAIRDPGNEALVIDVSRRLVQANRLNNALELLIKASEIPGASGAIYARLGSLYTKLGKPELAMKANRQAVRKDPRSLAGYQNLFLTGIQNKRPNEALAVLDEASKVSDAGPDFLISLAEMYASYGLQFPAQRQLANDRALAALDRARNPMPGDPKQQLKLADGYNLLGKDDKAAGLYTQLLDSPSGDVVWRETIRSKLAEIYLRGHDPKRASEQLEAVLREDPTDVRAYYALGTIAYDNKRYDDAADYFTKVLLLEPGLERVYYELADTQISRNKSQEALDTLSQARQRFSDNFFVEYLSGVAYSRQKDFTNAFNRFNSAEIIALARDTNLLTREFHFQFGAACERISNFAQAEVQFEKCLALSPDFAEAMNYLGFMWADRGENLSRARDLIARALQDDPENAAYLDSMAWVLYKLGQPKQALNYILDAIKRSEEEDATLYDHLGDIYARLGEAEKARVAWNKSLTIEPNEQVRKKIDAAKH